MTLEHKETMAENLAEKLRIHFEENPGCNQCGLAAVPAHKVFGEIWCGPCLTLEFQS